MKSARYGWTLFFGSLAVALSALVAGCGKDEGNPRITIRFGTYTALHRWMNLFIPEAMAAVNSSRFCFKRLRFKTQNEGTSSDPTDDSDNIDFMPGEIPLSTSGTTLGEVVIPPGTYTRVEFDLERDGAGCASGKSVHVSNGAGDFSTDERVTVKFEGTFQASGSGQVLALGVQNIIDALDQVVSDDGIKDRLEDASVKGTF